MRLFIGLSLDENARQDTARLAARAQEQISGRYVLKSNYHLTLAFLGEVTQAQLPAAKQALDAFASEFRAPLLTLGPLSFFGKPSNAILIRTAQHPDDLFSMRASLLSHLRARSLPFTDGPFSPHVTIARHADASLYPPEEVFFKSVSFSPPQVTLYLSARDEQNILRYTPLYCASFGASL